VEEVVGWQVRERREALGLTQEQLGRQLEPLLGRPWSRQAVSAAEKGDRSFGAAELVALATALQTTVGDLLRPPVQESAVDLGGHEPVSRDLLYAVIASRLPEDLNFAAIQDTLTQLADTANRSQADVGRMLELAQRIDILMTERVAEGGVVRSAPADTGLGPTPVYSGKYFRKQQPTQEDALPSVITAIVTSPLGVLVGRRNDGKPPWTFISGEQDAVQDESPSDTAVREVKEETGLRVETGEVIGERVHPRTGRHMIYMAARPTHGTEVIVGDEEELAEVRWVSLAEANELMAEYGMFEPVHEYLAREIGA
jgi:8-oxo-dGTP diphosphatase